MKNQLTFNFADDSHFAELKIAEVRRGRLEDASIAEEFVGVYLSREYIYKKILMFTDEEIKEQKDQMKKEEAEGDLTDVDDADDGEQEIGKDPVPDINKDGKPDLNSPSTKGPASEDVSELDKAATDFLKEIMENE